jgi:hypothetical protein
MENKADLYLPVFATKTGPAPLVIRAVVHNNAAYIGGGVPQTSWTPEDYVLVSALPKEIQERVKVAVQSIISGM